MTTETLNQVDRAKGLARVFKALGDENRLAIFQLLRERCAGGCEVSEDGADRTVSEIAKDFDLALSTVSHHLKELRTAGLILCEKRGKQVHCRVNSRLLGDLEAFMREV
jgi:DNA-binding transcriptional ArsR family regulator